MIEVQDKRFETVQHFRDLITELIPESILLIGRDGMDWVIRINQLLGNDLKRLHKMAIPIWIKISYEAIEDYSESKMNKYKTADKNFFTLIKKRLEGFNPDHDVPFGLSPEPEIWIVRSADLF